MEVLKINIKILSYIKEKFINSSLSRKLLFNYIILFIVVILSLVILISLYFLGIYFYSNLMSKEKKFFMAHNIINDDYKEIRKNDVLKVGGWIEILNNDLKIIDKHNSDKNIGYTYDKEVFFETFFNRGIQTEIGIVYVDKMEQNDFDVSKYSISVAYNKKGEYFLLSAIPKEVIYMYIVHDDGTFKSIPSFLVGNLIIYLIIVLVIAIFLIYTIVTAKVIVNPLKKILKGVQKIENGEYDTQIEMKSKNEIGQLNKAINKMAIKIKKEITLKEKSEENRKKLILDISHDIRNPLTNIVGYSDYLIKNKNISTEEIYKYISILNNSSKRVDYLINDLFQLSHIESTGAKLNLVNDDICEFTRTFLLNYIPHIEEKGFEYDIDIPDEDIRLNFDKKLIDRAFCNIINNTLKFNKKGTKLYFNIERFIEKNSKYIKIVIGDNGFGIKDDIKENIFEPFVKLKDEQFEKNGYGLGLAITKAIIDKHNGSISINKEKNVGCEFIILL